ncbi:MaoC family dehydratase [Aliikangiella sp. IMCC44359]|uniref:MaoC family dehydratase n=1 Tax=Aliikangiella sp. IMCC44359 TaxID=3459125 RepID=UPI00403AAE0D
MRQLEITTGNLFEDFKLGQVFQHGVPRTITQADATLYTALTGSRFPLHCAETVSLQCGFAAMPIDNLLVFHIAFGKTVNDISLNAIANLGYAEVKFLFPCFAGDTLSVSSEVIGLKETSDGKRGIVYVRSIAVNQYSRMIVSWIRWVMVEKKQEKSQNIKQNTVPKYCQYLTPEMLSIPSDTNFTHWEKYLSHGQLSYNTLKVGDRIFHQDGITINQSDHALATHLYQNNARVHFNQHLMKTKNHGRRLVYGGHIISLCRAISYNGLGNAIWLAAINSGQHTNPTFANDTIYCQSEIIDKKELKKRTDIALIRIKMQGIKDATLEKLSKINQQSESKPHEDLVLQLDYWAYMLK